jgi:N,N'-diacetyllegionaminate synthase
MTDYKNLEQVNKFIQKKIGKNLCKKNIAYLHCVTSYPVYDNQANLKSISFLRKKFNNLIGYSDHTLGNEACLSAVALGARIVEKHFTLNKKFSNFRDHALSADFNDLKELVKSIRRIEIQLGTEQKKIITSEKTVISLARRGIYASKKIKKGEKLSLENIKFLRPAKSKKFSNLKKIMSKISKRDYTVNQKIN